MAGLPVASTPCDPTTFGRSVGSNPVFVKAGLHLLSCAIETSSARTYQSGLNKFREFIRASSEFLGVVPPRCETSQDLRALIMAPSVVPAFLTFCADFGLASSTVGVYIDGLKHFATDLVAAPVIPEPAVVVRLLEGFSRVGKRPNPKKEGVNGEILKEIIVALPFMGLSPFDVRLWTALFVTAYFGCFRVSEFLISSDKLKLLSLGRVELRPDGSFRLSLFKTKNNVKGPVQFVSFTPLSCELLCPVRALEAFLEVRRGSPLNDAFFTSYSGVPITSHLFNVMLRKVLTFMSVPNVGHYSAKSFRVGAFMLDIPFGDIRALGRWASEAFLVYIRSGACAARASRVHRRLARRL